MKHVVVICTQWGEEKRKKKKKKDGVNRNRCIPRTTIRAILIEIQSVSSRFPRAVPTRVENGERRKKNNIRNVSMRIIKVLNTVWICPVYFFFFCRAIKNEGPVLNDVHCSFTEHKYTLRYTYIPGRDAEVRKGETSAQELKRIDFISGAQTRNV